MKHHLHILGVLLCVLMLMVPVMSDAVLSSDDLPDNPNFAPVNPDFATYLTERQHLRFDDGIESTGVLGLVPSSVDLSFTRGSRIEQFSNTITGYQRYENVLSTVTSQISHSDTTVVQALPGRFDLRTMGKTSRVQDQGQCGSCWAFSSLASLESVLLPESWDFSENNMRNTHGYDLSSCQGGNSLMATAYLARWSGALTEASDPYTTVSRSATTVTSPNTAAVKHVQQVLFIPGRSGSLDNENIKRALVEKGAVYSTIRWEDSSYRSTYASFYYSGSSRANHAITIVGWDDNYDRTKFRSIPQGNGAFIVKNSWGPEWGENGYFYVSYYDSVIGKDNALFTAEDPGTYDTVYQYDPLGWVSSYGENSDTAFFANIFTAKSEEDLVAASFYTAAPGSTYQIWIYTGVQNTPVAGSARSTQSGTIEVPGYHTIPLTTPVHLKKGDRFSIVVRLNTPGNKYPVPVEYPISGFSSGARAGRGESFVSGSGTSWTDLSTAYQNANVCLKAFTRSSTGTPYATPTPTPTPTSPTVTPTPTPSTPASDTKPPVVSIISPRSISTVTPGTSLSITWSSSDDRGIAGVDIAYSGNRGQSWETTARGLSASGTYPLQIPADASGTLMIRVTARDISGNEASATRTCIVRTSYFSSSLVRSAPTDDTPTPPDHTSLVPGSIPDTRAPLMTLLHPPAYLQLTAGDRIPVTWRASDDRSVGGVDIAYSTDGGVSWETAGRDLAAIGTYSLLVPADASGTFMIRVTGRDPSGNEASVMRSWMIRSSSSLSQTVQAGGIAVGETDAYVPASPRNFPAFTVPTVTPHTFDSRMAAFLEQ
jgi:C1A family cysteine protease